jgi:hypothetical protein
MDTSEQGQETAMAYRMPVLDEGLFRAVDAGGPAAAATLALQDLMEAKRELLEIREQIDQLRLVVMAHGHDTMRGVTLPASVVIEPPLSGAMIWEPGRMLHKRGDQGEHPYAEQVREASADADRIRKAARAGSIERVRPGGTPGEA